MILDKLLQFDAGATAITASAASTNTLDMLNARDIAIGGNMDQDPLVVVTVGVTFTAAGAATLTIQCQASVDNASWTTVSQTDAIPKANLTAGTVIKLPLGLQQPQSAGIPRYYRLNYVVATGPMTAGQIEADLVIGGMQLNNPPVYPSGFTVTN
jgi:hypothetical protein